MKIQLLPHKEHAVLPLERSVGNVNEMIVCILVCLLIHKERTNKPGGENVENDRSL